VDKLCLLTGVIVTFCPISYSAGMGLTLPIVWRMVAPVVTNVKSYTL